MIETVENIPVNINLLSYINVTGWRVDSGKAIKEKCSGGFIYSRNVFLEKEFYNISYTIDSVGGGNVDVYFGGVLVGSHSSSGAYSAFIKADTSDIRIFGGVGVSAQIGKFTYSKFIEGEVSSASVTVAFSEKIDKWTSFYTYSPEYGVSLKRNLFTFKNGGLWKHDVSYDRNNFYGVQYETKVKFPISTPINIIKGLHNIAIQSDKLMITTVDGIETSLGQISDLLEGDFRQFTLSDGITSVDVYDREGVFFAKFLRDKNSEGGILFGEELQGDSLLIELTTINDRNVKLFSVYINFDPSLVGV